jgi:hypothetical protein
MPWIKSEDYNGCGICIDKSLIQRKMSLKLVPERQKG